MGKEEGLDATTTPGTAGPPPGHNIHLQRVNEVLIVEDGMQCRRRGRRVRVCGAHAAQGRAHRTALALRGRRGRWLLGHWRHALLGQEREDLVLEAGELLAVGGDGHDQRVRLGLDSRAVKGDHGTPAVEQ